MGSTSHPSVSASADTILNQVSGYQHIEGGMHFYSQPSDVREDCRLSLAFPGMDDAFHNTGYTTGGTCEWLLEHKKWEHWISSDHGLLWIKGKPGSGKSTLLRYAVRKMKETKAGGNALILSYFFHGRGDDLQRNPLGLFKSLLCQVLTEDSSALSGLVDAFRKRRYRKKELGIEWKWELDELRNHFGWSILELLGRRQIWIFVDALDECGHENAKDVIQNFKGLLQGSPAHSKLRICFTCRHYPILNWDTGFEICVEDENSQDISTYLQARLDTFRRQTASPIAELINQRANGLFIWARLVVDRLIDLEFRQLELGEDMAKVESEIKEIIDAIPQDLDELYLDIVRSMENTLASQRLVQWICCAQETLSLDELRWAMVIDANCPCKSLEECKGLSDYIIDNDVMERKVKILGRGLIEIVPSSNTRIAQFIHQSVRDFFEHKGLLALDDRDGSTQAGAYSAIGIAHYHLSRACTRYLEMEEIGLIEDTPQDGWSWFKKTGLVQSIGPCFPNFPLLEYATRWWGEHLQISQTKKICQEDLLRRFGWPSERAIKQWVHIFRILHPYSPECPPTGINLVHILSRYNWTTLLRMILEQTDQAGINARDYYGRTPLVYAVERGHKAAAKILLENKADANSQDSVGAWYRDKFICAQYEYEQRVIQQTGCRAIAAILVKNEVDLNVHGPIGASPLHWAVFRGHMATVSLLLASGADIKRKGEGGCTPLAWAIESKDNSMVETLLETDLELDYEYTLPHHAHRYSIYQKLAYDRISFIEFFGIDSPPCFWMPQPGTCWVWRILDHPSLWLQVKERLSIFGNNDDKPMIGEWNHESSKVRSTCGDRTPLLRAVELGERSIVRMLLTKGASPDFQGSHGWSPLSLAKEKRDETLIELLEGHQKSSTA